MDEQHGTKGNKIPVVIDGVSYESIADASRKLGVTRATIEKYIRNGSPPPPMPLFQKVVISVVSVIILAILGMVLLARQEFSKTDDDVAESATKQSSVQKDKDYYFDAPTNSTMTFKEFREDLVAQDVDLTKIKWYIWPDSARTKEINQQTVLQNLADDVSNSLNDLDGNWQDKNTGKTYDGHTIVQIFQVDNGVRENLTGGKHIEWQNHQVEVWLSQTTLDEQMKVANEQNQRKEERLFNDYERHKVKLLFDMNIRSFIFADSQVIYMAKAGTELYISNTSGLGGTGPEWNKPQENCPYAVYDKNGVCLGFMAAHKRDMSEVYVEVLNEIYTSYFEKEAKTFPSILVSPDAKVEVVLTTKETPCYSPRMAGGISEAAGSTVPANTELYVTYDNSFKTHKYGVAVGAFITENGALAYVETESLVKK
ncbi:hypothetical protein Hs30E_16630 [Lactococcus hodotermopsidis]|uniref:Uncharacterized protein n=1 Tax=Pseudolactococcus hodotermopsidis TaxID=2709157 RepID=A0A6A0BCK3_9LACT|nr:hypothetical protein [Lactococcus hodotermopsidis]GFH43112.1 hypothetical protein Hs30E_16630 [Lactococcus hodotermopsidis]